MKHLKVLLLFILIVLYWQSVGAYDFKIDGLCYVKNSDGTSVTVVYQTLNSTEPCYPNLSGALVIPPRVYYANKYYTVTGIGSSAFANCVDITSVTIPSTLTKIGNQAFYRCSGLTSLIIPNSLTSIGNSAFSNCVGLVSLSIGNSVTSIGTQAFYNCSGLTSVTIPNSVTTIGNGAFSGCTGLTSVTIPNSVTDIGTNPFSSCSNLIEIIVDESNIKYDSRNNCNAIIKTETNSLIAGCKNSFIPNSVISIDNYAFNGCSDLSSMDIPNHISSIGIGAFYNCTGLSSIYLPNSVTSIGDNAFCNCTCLNELTIGNSVTTIGDYAFKNCTSLTNIYNFVEDPHNISLGSKVFENVNQSNCILTVRSSSINLYNSGQWWYFSLRPFCESISLNKSLINIGNDMSETLIANTLPNYASQKVTWSSSNSNVASVDQNGVVTAKAIGTVMITATTTDKTNLSASCEVKVFVPVNSISLNYTSAIINKGSTLTLLATVLPDYAYKTLVWTSSNTNIATVDQNGKVTAKALGTATITATTTDGTNLSATCTINVVQPVTSISLSQASAIINKENSLILTATILPTNAYNKTLLWTSSNTNIATVDQNGKVTAKNVGNTTITATTTDGSNLSASCEINVIIPVNYISLNQTSANIYKGNTLTLTATVLPTNATIKTLNWTSSNTSVATVDQNGIVTAKDVGMSTITATTTDGTNLSASCEVHVYNIASSITLNQSQVTLNAGDSETLTVTILPSNTLAHQFPIQWTSSDNNIATVDSTGKITAIKNGTALITASTTDGTNLSATCQVTVITLASSITLDRSKIIMYKGDFDALTATILPETTSNKNVNWSSSNSSIVSVDNAGNINAKSTGIASIIATTTDGTNLSATCRVEVYNRVSSVYLNYSSFVIEKGETKQIVATVSPSNAYNKKLLWSSSNPSVAEVDSTGLVRAISVGSTVISATTTDGSDITATCNVEVIVHANAVVLNKHETSIFAGETEQLTAQVLPEDADNKTVTWRTTNSTVASVNSSGLVTANKVGTAQIIATCNGISDTCAVTVMGITNLTLDKHELTMDIESTETLNVAIEPQEAINKNLTWRSLNTSIAIVSSLGVITPLGIGITKIIVQATDGSNVSDTCVVTVIPAYDLYPTTTELVHVRGQSDFSAVIPFWLSNKTAISGLQFDITLPTGVSFATVDDYPDVWLDANRKARNHTVDVNLISGSKYRVLVSSPTNNTFKGNEGEVLYMRLNVDRAHPIGSYYINTSNVIFVEPDETQHTGYNKSVKIDYKYLLGDADGDARVDVADYTVTALYILNRPTEVFYSDAANVSGDNQISVTDLVGITNISLGIRPHEYRPAPAIMMNNETQESNPTLNASVEGDNIVALSIDNDTPLAGMQLDLQLPQGMTLADATLEGRAAEYQIGENTLADGKVRLLISSFGDKDIEAGNDAVIKLVLAGNNVNNEMLYITGAQAASRDLKSYELNDVTLPVGTTSIDDMGYSYDKLSIYGKGNTIVVNSPSAMLIQVVHVNGMVMPVEIKPGHNTIDVGGHGVYIIRVGNSAYKVRL